MEEGVLAHLFGRKGKRPECTACGSEIAYGGKTVNFCHFCEAEAPQVHSPRTETPLADIQSLLDKGMLAEAAKETDAAVSNSTDPLLLFASAQIYRFISGVQYYDLNYSRKGFMEENSSNIYASLDSTAKYKELFYKSLAYSEGHDGNSIHDPDLAYLAFISYVRLKNLQKAGERLHSIVRSRRSHLYRYAHMVYSIESKLPEGEREAEALILEGNVNASFYLAKAMTNRKDLTSAYTVLKLLVSNVRMPDAVFMMNKVSRLIEETRV